MANKKVLTLNDLNELLDCLHYAKEGLKLRNFNDEQRLAEFQKRLYDGLLICQKVDARWELEEKKK